MKMKGKSATLPLLAMAMVMGAVSGEECSLRCDGNGGICMIGSPDFTDLTPVVNGKKASISFLNETSLNNQYCKCNPGYTGVKCQHKIQSCNTPGSDGNTHKCFHGAECVLGYPDSFGNVQYYCDCTTTNHSENKKYAGRFCELEEVERCTEDGSIFCVNGGTCKDKVELKHLPCNCDEGYEGTHCEWEEGTMPECNLECENDGECVLGFKDYMTASKATELTFLQEKQIDMMNCICPEGFTGVKCQVKVGEKCGDGVCYNGSICVEKNGDASCDCRTSDDEENIFMGKYCETKVPCNLDCNGAGTCMIGNADFSDSTPVIKGEQMAVPFLHETNVDNQYCQCKPGYTGIDCSHTVESCNSSNAEGSLFKCFHDAECVVGLPDQLGNEQYHCDCTTTKHHQSKKYAGPFCQYEEAERCTADGSVFCVNGGTCKTDASSKSNPCHCGEDLEGTHCEWEKGTMPNCDLECENNGECVLGFKSYQEGSMNIDLPFLEKRHIDMMHCVCPEGFTGVRCEVEAGEECGDAKCYHGSKCVKTKDDEFCDCNTANDKDSSYSGRYCEYEALTWCTKDKNNNGRPFCVNGGTCREDSLEGCQCPDNFKGANCEYPEEAEIPSCGLQCSNGGKCRHGSKDFGIVHTSNWGLGFLNTTHINYEYCICPEGYTGLQCEYEVETCNKGEHNCLHGGSCVKVTTKDGEIKHACDCQGATNSTHNFAGLFCEHASTSLCIVEDSKTSQGEDGKSLLSFCTNDGLCKKIEHKDDRRVECECPDGFVGNHCELQIDIVPPNSVVLKSQNIEAECTLDCNGAGTCVRDGDNQYCKCDLGHTGLNCEETFNSCNSLDEKGSLGCFNGADCVLGFLDEFGNEQYHCDCNTTDHHNTIHYYGRFCQFEEAERCSHDGSSFCVNEGICKNTSDVDDNIANACMCYDGFEGPHCEWEKGSMPDCDLTCENDGQCIVGFKSFDEVSTAQEMHFRDTKQINMMSCVCPEGFTGDKCEIEINENCGDRKCHHGSKCVKSNDDEFCDCSTIKNNNTNYAGRYCEYKATSWCTKNEDTNGRSFCVNNGSCLKESHDGCTCPTGFKGNRCEYKEEAIIPSCNLNCEHDGNCHKGTKDFGTAIHSNWGLEFLNNSQIDYEYCVCPTGYTGLQCEYEVETCNKGEHNCLHGGSCVKVTTKDGKIKHACDCQDATNSTHNFAGLFCEHASTSLCIVEDSSTSQGEDGKSLLSFCTNDGTCKKHVKKGDTHHGCKCKDGFIGGHCELKMGLVPPTSVMLYDTGTLEDGDRTDVFVFSVLFSVLSVFALFVFIKRENMGAIVTNRHYDLTSRADLETPPGPIKGFSPDYCSDDDKTEISSELDMHEISVDHCVNLDLDQTNFNPDPVYII